ncbi:hypothetical protein QK355_07940 [Pseudomonas aeruginosa]|uniref:hypothetical protein n=1 Tax=Pseudomonas aeruginosa TaxID=287 RepID=UPI0038F7FEDC|nr:hypothetical protein [Pseudomonas aeruginosa]
MIAHVVANVREADRLEFEAIRGVDVEQELRNALEQSEEAFVLVSRGEPVVIFGCIRYDDRIGVPWMISTHAVARHRAAFLHECRDQIGRMRQRYAALINYTDARYEQALRWMQWLGFDMLDAVEYGVNGELFHPFTMRGELWAQH